MLLDVGQAVAHLGRYRADPGSMHIGLGTATSRPTGRQPVSLNGRVGALIPAQDRLIHVGPPFLTTCRAHACLHGALITTRHQLVRTGPRVPVT
ncbi:hypothetical protein AW168_38995 [Nocardia brasiliensis]|uniref:Uncharacterized protein n=1 Tax=Nocardia brasiliensis (strain ATCC 700358 / HUJEG-1) TaxID=1133849 RepID=K0F410_NOCB7|nr:hypothetical protein O3I_029680 [Nocardia brasiliensis ATCC 700358]OCF84879.1 hypothetical protein AW168_38995 [Nocardia brasiliensis]